MSWIGVNKAIANLASKTVQVKDNPECTDELGGDR
jgi:hypothetical protein